MKEFDYYIFIDYSENFVGYLIVSNVQLKILIPKISRLRHYKDSRNRKLYLKNVNKMIKREKIIKLLTKMKIRLMNNNIEIYSDLLEFLRCHEKCIIFISVDNRQYQAFKKMINLFEGNNITVKQESELREGSPEYRISLLIDNLLNIERRKDA